MGLYARYVLARLVDVAMRRGEDTDERAKLVPLASGVVLEIGIGSALNAPFLGPRVERLCAIDPSLPLWRLAQPRVHHLRVPVRRWQERLNPMWRRIAGGCHLDRPIDALITGAGFRVSRIECGYAGGPKPFTYHYRGIAEADAT